LVVSSAITVAVLLLAAVGATRWGPRQFVAAVKDSLDQHDLYGPRTRMRRDTRWYAQANPDEDARKAVRKGDHRLIPAMWAYSPFPGFPRREFQELDRKYGSMPPIDADCDAEESAEQAAFQAVAYEYASRYNRAVVESRSR